MEVRVTRPNAPNEEAHRRRQQQDQRVRACVSDRIQRNAKLGPRSPRSRKAAGSEALVATHAMPQRKRLVEGAALITAAARLDEDDVGCRQRSAQRIGIERGKMK